MSTQRLVRRDFCLRVCQSVSAAIVAAGCAGTSATAPSDGGSDGPQASPAANPPPLPAAAESPPLSSLPPPAPGLLTEIPMLAGTVVGRELRIPLDLSSPVAIVGGVARSQAFVGNGLYRDVLIARVDPQSFSTLNATCTHEGCVVSRFAAPLYVCPCHGSRYDLLGAVVQGPAPAALPQLAAAYARGVLTVNI